MTNNKKTLVYIDGANPEDKRSWSGIPYNLVQQLKRNYDVETIWLQETKAEKLFRLTYKFFGVCWANTTILVSPRLMLS